MRPKCRCPAAVVCVVFLSLGACSSGSSTCAPAGKYTATLTRSADPGDCPPDVDVLDAKTIEISEGEFCATDRETFSGTHSSSSGPSCSYQGSGTLTPSADGISGRATISSNCWGDTTQTCTAKYDIVYTRVQADSGVD